MKFIVQHKQQKTNIITGTMCILKNIFMIELYLNSTKIQYDFISLPSQRPLEGHFHGKGCTLEMNETHPNI